MVHHLEMELGMLEAKNPALQDTNEEQARQTINTKHHIVVPSCIEATPCRVLSIDMRQIKKGMMPNA
jgi:sulfur relay (sulfurtransferase) complex TusBCD TusD component (DsrE family)